MTLRPSLLRIGIPTGEPPRQARAIALTNRVSIIIFFLTLLLFGLYASLYPWTMITTSIPIVGAAALVGIGFNALGMPRAARIWLCLLLPLSCLFVSIVSKLVLPWVQDSEYYEFRFIMLASAVLPCILFRVSEQSLLLPVLAFHFLALALYDPLHNLFGAGYYQMAQADRTYYFTNVIVLLTMALLVISILSVKMESEAAEEKNRRLIEDLEYRGIHNEEQKQQIMAQSRILSANQHKLSEAYRLIERQKELLSRENKSLEDEVMKMNEELSQTNEELIRSNNELRQFSFTVSHNLRGPVASLLGLVDLLNMDEVDEANRRTLEFIRESAHQLDDIMGDLREITDIRNDVFNVRQRFHVEQELEKILEPFRERLGHHDIQVRTDIDCPEFFTVRPFVHNILDNLISNAIKYRSTVRQPVIDIGSSENDSYYILTVQDNGLGIDLKRHGHDLFRLYKRFHAHNDGRGLGLYLVKLQAESLGGFVDIRSEVDQYTRFTVYLKKPVTLTRQVLYNMDHALIYFDARINAMGVTWRGPVTGVQYRDTFRKCLDFLQSYGAPAWISDIIMQGPVSRDDQQWMFREIIPEAARNGLRYVVGIVPSQEDPAVAEYVAGIAKAVHSAGCELGIFGSLAEATQWIQQQQEKNSGNVHVEHGAPS